MFELTTNEKVHVLQKIINIFEDEKEFNFSESNYSNFFGNINLSGLENYLNKLSKKGFIHFGIYAEDGFEARFDMSIVDFEKLLMEYKSVKKQLRNSYKHKKSKYLIRIMILLLITLMLMLIYSLFFSPYSLLKELLLPIISVLLTCCTVLITSVMKREQERDEILNYSQKLKNTIISSNKYSKTEVTCDKKVENVDENDALKLMLVNMEEIKAYYTLSKTQAKDSFRLAVWMCILGFILIVLAVILPFLMSGKYEISIITAIGGAIVEVIAGTSLFVYKNSLAQLNHYYESLHENERFLSTVNLVRKLKEDKQDEMYIEIIRSSIKRMNNFN